ncbi:MAG: hypothetical protein P4L53_03810 [Candidatus Obscuribacterales bacterium]|nr:hypothetical protein [Candidatus Obscuribacterales bacterium]
MSNASRRWLAPVMVAGMVLGCSILVHAWPEKSSIISYVVDEPLEVHLQSDQEIELQNPDPHKVYIVESGVTVSLHGELNLSMQDKVVQIRVRSKGILRVTGANIAVTAEPGATVIVGDGVAIDGEGATIYVQGASNVKAFNGTTVYNYGNGEEHAYEGSVTYARTKGRVFAERGSLVYAKSPDNCDACTQVALAKGATVHVYEGAEAFGKSATVYVYRGGEVGCSNRCTLYLHPGAESNYSTDAVVHQVSDQDDPPALFLEPDPGSIQK